MASTYHYRIIKSSWGVAIDITAEMTSVPIVGAKQVTDTIYLSMEAPIGLMSEERAYLVGGLRLVADQIHSTLNAPVMIRILELTFNHCDYQPEGLACAIAGWVAQEMGFEPPTIQVTFDRQLNQYQFDFPADNASYPALSLSDEPGTGTDKALSP